MNRIAELRKKNGWSQSTLAEKLGIAQNTLSQYENELRRPSSRVTLLLSDLFRVSPNYLLGESDISTENSSVASALYDLQLVTKIVQETNFNRVNLYLRKGWRLLHVGEHRVSYDDGSCSSSIIYSIGWFNRPDLAQELPKGIWDEDEKPLGWE